MLEDQIWNTENICALANSGGGFIFIADYTMNEQGNYRVKGFTSASNF